MDTLEKELLDQLKYGSEESFQSLYAQYGQKVYTFVFGILGNREDTEDVIQQTFFQAYANIAHFQGESSLNTWLCAIAKNISYRLIEKRSKSTFQSLENLIHTVASNVTYDTFTEAERNFYVHQVKDGCLFGLVQCLSFHQRVAFVGHILLDLSIKTISTILNKSENATRVLIHRARRNIKSFLCRNCSLFDPSNPCHCENLIDFSLKKEWIQPFCGQVDVPSKVQELEKEINHLKKITSIYKSISSPLPSQSLAQSIQQLIKYSQFSIFSMKKVK